MTLAALATGCTTDPAAPGPSPSTPADQGTAEQLPDYHSGPKGAPAQPPGAQLRWDATARAAAERRAGLVMRRFARPTLDDRRWWAELEPLLSPQAQRDYYGVDPRNVPPNRVTAAPRLASHTQGRVAIVHVDTDAGLYAVTLSRNPQSPAWAAERITPPEPDPHGENEDPAEGGGTGTGTARS